MAIDRELAARWARAYGSTWSQWDVDAFVALFSDDVIYVDHPTGQTVRGRADLAEYVRNEQREQGPVAVRMGEPVVEGNRLAAEFWATGEDGAIAGGFVARLDEDGRCSLFREYWFELEGPVEPFPAWGR
jgi:ketosteroid isomerase-like protein